MGPFTIKNPESAHAALCFSWGDYCDEITEYDGLWFAHREGAPEGELITGATPDELNRKIRSDWLSRQRTPVPPQRGPSGMGPS
jgi:hypothetical protein